MKVLTTWLVLAASVLLGDADTTITVTNRYAWGANVGWIDACGDTNHGASIGEFVCSGYLYAANVGWIHLGGNVPANGIRYQNVSGTDYGVNRDGLGNLRGYAWGANIGWVSFEDTGAPKVDLVSGKLNGYVWSANCGWISLSNASTIVQTASVAAGADSDSDGIADGWELTFTNKLDVFTTFSDTDQDGMTDNQEYLADTDPLDANDSLRIISFMHNGSYNLLSWTSKSTRLYQVERRTTLDVSSAWESYIVSDLLGWNNVEFHDTGPQYFYRIRSVRPLMP